MKVAVSATGKEIDANIDPRFGRCACFLIIESDDMNYISFENDSSGLSGGAGIQAAGFVADQGVTAVLTGNCGPNAMKVFAAAGIRVYTGQTGTVREGIERLKAGGLTPSTEPTVTEKAGMAPGAVPDAGTAGATGRCRGGMGRGMGMGGGRGMCGGGGMGRGGRGMGRK